MVGRDSMVTANSSASVGGVVSATLMIDQSSLPFDPTAWAAVALHEAFHVFQRERHPSWVGNEGDLLRYPFENAKALALRRLESAALRRASIATSRSDALCWTREFVHTRRARYAALDSASRTYERRSELNEGLATYVQALAGAKRINSIPASEFAAEAVRERVYATGAALALLLDLFAPEWKAELETDDRQQLDDLLDRATRRLPASRTRRNVCGFSGSEKAQADSRAQRDSAELLSRRESSRSAFEAIRGWRVSVLATASAPLWPQGFDPSNLAIVRGGLIHARFVKLGNNAGSLEAMRSASAPVQILTEAAGAHPLFNGVRRAEIVGLGPATVESVADTVSIIADGLRLRFAPASVLREGQHVHVTLRTGS